MRLTGKHIKIKIHMLDGKIYTFDGHVEAKNNVYVIYNDLKILGYFSQHAVSHIVRDGAVTEVEEETFKRRPFPKLNIETTPHE